MKSIPIPKLPRSFTAARDENGVPHIQAETWQDALFGLGYMHVLDRGTQLLFARSVASGRASAEISSTPELYETDCFFRRVGLHLELEREVRLLEDRVFNQLTAYSEGVNEALRTVPRSLPMWATGFQAQPWNHQSVMLIGKLLSFGGLAISQMQNERLLLELIHAGVNEDVLRELFAPRLENVDFEMIRQIKMSNQLSNDALELLTDLPRIAGSNAWAVSPDRSASGGALLASDPHLEINRLPAIWYEAVLRWDDRYVMGASLPGCPLFAVARTNNLAWGVTYMKGDTVDYFVEDCRRGGETGWQYRRGEDWFDFRCRNEEIHSRPNGPETLKIYENEQGTLDGDPEVLGAGLHLSICWSGNHEGNGAAIGTWLDVIASPDAAAAMRVARDCTQPTLCWVFADREGHIGMQTCGRFPIRGGDQIGLAPIPAWDEANHWRGWLRSEALPRIYDPPEGFVATANEEINPVGLPMLATQPLADYRKRRIVERLEQLPQATIEDMQDLQYDVYSVQAREMLARFMPHLPDEMRERLQSWDCRFDPDSHEATLFQRLYRNVIAYGLGHDQGIGWHRIVYLCTRVGYSLMVLTAADRLLDSEDSLWWRERDKGQLIRQAADRTLSEPDQPWSAVNYFHFTDRFFGGHQVGRMLGFDTRRYPMAGCHATPFQGHVLQTATRTTTFAPSYHLVTDLSEDRAWTNLPGGPSESAFSRYYKSDLDRWFTGEYKTLELEPEDDR